jgi:hypothetical protein
MNIHTQAELLDVRVSTEMFDRSALAALEG